MLLLTETARRLRTSAKRIRQPATAADRMRDMRARKSTVDLPDKEVLKAARERREVYRLDLRGFATWYFPHIFFLPFAQSILKDLDDLQEIILHGGRYARAKPRGTGKTTVILIATLWAMLYGHRTFSLYFASNLDQAKERIANLKALIRPDPVIYGDYAPAWRFRDDWPELLACVEHLGDKEQRASSQLAPDGNRTQISWSTERIAFPRLSGFSGAGASIAAKGLGGAARGALRDTGRPDWVAIDDPERDSDAASPAKIRQLRKVIRAGLTRLAGLGGNLAMVYIGTVIEPGDLTDEFTDRKRQPAWNGQKVRFLDGVGEIAKRPLWMEYTRLRREKDESDPHAREAHKFYLENREEIENGITENFPHNYAGRHYIQPPDTESRSVFPDGTESEVSATQTALNIIADDGEEVFFSELQNEPKREIDQNIAITARQASQRLTRLSKGIVPEECNLVTAHIDVGHELLHYSVCAFRRTGFGGSVIDYGMHAVKHLPDGIEASVRSALDELVKAICGRTYDKPDGEQLHIEQLGVDSGSKLAETVYRFCRESVHSRVLIPTKGWGSNTGHRVKAPKGARKKSTDCYVASIQHGSMRVPLCTFDTNRWKIFVHTRLAAPVGGKSALMLYGDDPAEHIRDRGHGQHSQAGYLVQVLESETPWKQRNEKNGEFYIWTERHGVENHWFDTLVGAHIMAALCGAGVEDTKSRGPRMYRTLGQAIGIS